MQLDSNLAWKEATRLVGANREVLAVLAGVFFLVPSLAIALFYPQPEPAAGATPEQAFALVGEWYSAAAPVIIGSSIIQAIGSLAILTLFTDSARPTVAAALRSGATGMLSYIGAQLLVGVAAALVIGLPLALAITSGSPLLIVVVVLAAIVAIIAVALRTVLVAPVIAVEGRYNPIEALRRSWELTGGNALRILLFFFLLVLVFGIILGVTMMVVGVVLALALDLSTAKTAAAVISSAMTAAFTVYILAALAGIHRQLAGPSHDGVADTFS